MAAVRRSEAEQKRYEREAAAAYAEARRQEVEELNEDHTAEYEEIDGLLAATLSVDDYVDLEAMKQHATHPAFTRPQLESPTPRPDILQVPPAPVWQEPEPSKALFGKQKKTEEARQRARAAFAQAMQEWETYRDAVPVWNDEAQRKYFEYERARTEKLQAERDVYDAECRVREEEAATYNAAIDALIAGLGYGAVDAVQEYVGLVLANSIYPESFDVDHDAEFDPDTAELKLTVIVPAPETLRTVKAYRYVKATDEVAESQLSKKDANDRYAGALNQVALRSLHEIFEADRRGVIQAISLQVGPRTKEPATGREMFLPLVAVTSARETFLELDLSGVVPAATLQHLGAAVSKNPSALAVIDPSGVRRL